MEAGISTVLALSQVGIVDVVVGEGGAVLDAHRNLVFVWLTLRRSAIRGHTEKVIAEIARVTLEALNCVTAETALGAAVENCVAVCSHIVNG